MKYILVKGWNGFGDRLESLKMCVEHAIKYSIPIYVDWRDAVWSNGPESFYTYFNLNLPTFSLDDIKGLSTYPAYWTGRCNDILTQTIINDNPETDVGYILPNCTEDVLVVSCYARRMLYTDSTFFASVFRVIDSRVKDEVLNRQKKYTLSKQWGIHLRGTDRTRKISKTHRIAEMNLKLVTSGLLNGATLIAVSDDLEFTTIWKHRYSKYPVLSNSLQATSEGLHYEKTESKDTHNVNLLIDFFTLASCARVFSTIDDSRFAKEAIRMHSHITQIFESIR